MLRKSNKTKYTATYKPARYIGSHPHIHNLEGVYYWKASQNSFVFRPDTDDEDIGKLDWYRVHKENLVDLKSDELDEVEEFEDE